MTQKCCSSTWIRKFKKRNKIFHKILSFSNFCMFWVKICLFMNLRHLQKNSSHKKYEKVAATLLLPLSMVLSFTLSSRVTQTIVLRKTLNCVAKVSCFWEKAYEMFGPCCIALYKFNLNATVLLRCSCTVHKQQSATRLRIYVTSQLSECVKCSLNFCRLRHNRSPCKVCEEQVFIFIKYVAAKSRIYSSAVTKKSLQSTAIEDAQQAPHC